MIISDIYIESRWVYTKEAIFKPVFNRKLGNHGIMIVECS